MPKHTSKKAKQLERDLAKLVDGLRDLLDVYDSIKERMDGLTEQILIMERRLRRVESYPDDRILH